MLRAGCIGAWWDDVSLFYGLPSILSVDVERIALQNYAFSFKYHTLGLFFFFFLQELQVEEGIAFIPNKEIDFEHYFDDVFGVTIPPSDVEKIRVVLQFSPKQYPYIVSKPLHHSQEIVDDENCILSVEVRPTYEFTQLILSFGKDVKVLEPEPYSQEIRDDIRRDLQNYDVVQIECTDQL